MEWISVSEKLPKEILGNYIVSVEFYEPWSGERYRRSYYAIYDPEHIQGDPDSDPYWFDGWSFVDDICEGEEIHITHWIPFPEPPKKSAE